MRGYPLERLTSTHFQALCQALLLRTRPGVQCFPLTGSDGGRDATSTDGRGNHTVFQVKMRMPDPLAMPSSDDTYAWVEAAVLGEVAKVQELAAKGANSYVLMTNASASGHLDSGLIDRVQTLLNDVLPIPAICQWRNDIERMLDGAFDIVMHYNLLEGPDALRAFLGETIGGGAQGDHMGVRSSALDDRVRALLTFVAAQHGEDAELKFKQAELQAPLLASFVDVPAMLSYASSGRSDIYEMWREGRSVAAAAAAVTRSGATPSFLEANRGAVHVGAASLFMHASDELADMVVLEGAPGQGKSTLGQYLCQVQRIRLLNLVEQVAKLPLHIAQTPLWLPIRIDLRDYATWLRREHPFTGEALPAGAPMSLEGYVAFLVTHLAGGAAMSVSDVQSVITASPSWLVLDGLDEVPDVDDRRRVVTTIRESIARLRPIAKHLRVLVTSRPAIFGRSLGFSSADFVHMNLADLTPPLVVEYTGIWLEQRGIEEPLAGEIRRTIIAKMSDEHVKNLARNPMQLAILLWLISRRSSSLPDKRTDLYDSYIDTFLDREVDKSPRVREYRNLLVELHGFVAWSLHEQAERGAPGRIEESALRRLLRSYLRYERQPETLIDDLFEGVVLRIFILVSRVEGTFEFEIQPLREYFVAHFLYQQAPSGLAAQANDSRPDRFDALARNPYWLNVTRYYAGFHGKGELADLARRLLDLADLADIGLALYGRQLIFHLLQDHVFDLNRRDVGPLAARLADAIGVRCSLSTSDRLYSPFHSPIGRRRMYSVGKTLSDRVGRETITGALWDGLVTPVPDPLLKELAGLLVRTSGAEDIATRWLNEYDHLRLTDVSAEALSWWIKVGFQVRALKGMSADRAGACLASLPEKHRPELLLTCNSEFVSSEVISVGDVAAAMRCFHNMDAEMTGSVWGALPTGEDNWAADMGPVVFFDSYASKRGGLRSRLETDVLRELVAASVPSAKSPDIARALQSCVDALEARDWSRSLEPYRKVVEGLEAAFGQSWLSVAVAVLGGTIANAKEKGSLEGNFDADGLLVDHFRYMRRHAMDADLWRRVLGDALASDGANGGGRDLAKGVILGAVCWSDEATLTSLIPELSEVLRTLTDAEYVSMVEYGRAIHSAPQPGTRRETAPSLGFLSSPSAHGLEGRLLIAAIRLSEQELNAFISATAQESSAFMQGVLDATRLDVSAHDYWRLAEVESLRGIAERYQRATFPVTSEAEVVYGQPHLARALRTGYTEEAVKEVIAEPMRYPADMVSMAALIALSVMEGRVQPLGDHARDKGWLPEQVWPPLESDWI